MLNDLLDAPCRFCGYNGPRYWQSGTHDYECPWHKISGADERQKKVADEVNKRLTFYREARMCDRMHFEENWTSNHGFNRRGMEQ